MTLLAPQEIRRSGLNAPVYSAATAGPGDTLQPGGDIFVHVRNGGAGAITATMVTTSTVKGGDLAVADTAVVIAAGSSAFIGPIDPETYATAPTGLAGITYSGVVTVTVAALRLKGAR